MSTNIGPNGPVVTKDQRKPIDNLLDEEHDRLVKALEEVEINFRRLLKRIFLIFGIIIFLMVFVRILTL